MLKKIVLSTLFASLSSLFLINSQTQAFVLDNSKDNAKSRPYCSRSQADTPPKTPLQESIERGKCESFVKAVGTINMTKLENDKL